MKYLTKVSKSGNSLSCRISKALADELKLSDGMEVSVESVEKGFNVRVVQPRIRPALPFRERDLVRQLTQKKAYADLLE